MFLPSFSRWSERPDTTAGLLAVLAITLPPLLLGPWLPLVDLAAYVGLNAYPPQQSYGPLHYHVFQFTYVGHLALSRLLVDLGFSTGQQILAIYLLEVWTFFGVIFFALRRLVDRPWLRAVGAALGSLACWDGLFLWGGPLAFSLAAACVAVAMVLTLREAQEPARPSGLPVALLCFLALICHPFALLFALILVATRLLFLPATRWASAGLAAALGLFAWVIIKDSPPTEGTSVAQLAGLFGFSVAEIGARLTGLFVQDAQTVEYVFGFVPTVLRGHFLILAGVHVAGFISAPILALHARENRALRLLGTFVSVIGGLYLFSTDAAGNPVPEWPQRILTFCSPFTFLAGFAGPIWLLRERARQTGSEYRLPRAARALMPPAILVGVVAVQLPILELSGEVKRSYEQLRDGIVRAGIKNAFVVVSDVDAIRPFYLRMLPMLLFSDPQLVANHLLLQTEWHHQARHPSRLAESWINLGRTRYLGRFASANGHVTLELVPQPADSFPTPANTNREGYGSAESLAFSQFTQGSTLLAQGAIRDAIGHFQATIRLKPDWPAAHNSLGVCFMNLEQLAQAKQSFEAALKLAPDFEEGQLNLVIVLLAEGDKVRAAERLDAILRVKPDSARALELARRAGLRP